MRLMSDVRRNSECDRKGTRRSWRGLELRLSRALTRWNEHGLRKGVARCVVPTCMCSGRHNWLVRQDGCDLL